MVTVVVRWRVRNEYKRKQIKQEYQQQEEFLILHIIYKTDKAQQINLNVLSFKEETQSSSFESVHLLL